MNSDHHKDSVKRQFKHKLALKIVDECVSKEIIAVKNNIKEKVAIN